MTTMNVINRTNGYGYINEDGKTINIYVFKQFGKCLMFLNDLFFSDEKYTPTYQILDKLKQNYFEISEFSLDFENRRFYVNGVGRYFKIRRADQPFEYIDNNNISKPIEETFENVNVEQQWIDNHTTNKVNKTMFGNIKNQKLICIDDFLIPTKQVYSISYKHMNIAREIKLIEY